MHQDKADLTIADRLRKTKDNMFQRIEDEYNWRWNDLWCYGPIITVWGNWWSRTFQKSSLHDSLLDLLIQDIHKPSFVDESAKFGVRWIQHCVM